MDKSALLVSSQSCEQRHQFLELLLVVSMSFELGASFKVENLDQFFERSAVSVDALHDGRVEVLLEVELSDLILGVNAGRHMVVEPLAEHLLEKSHLVLAVARLGQFSALAHVERKSEQLLAVRTVQAAQRVDLSLVLSQSFMQLRYVLLGSAGDSRTNAVVNSLLKLDRVGDFGELLIGKVTDVFKAVDLAEIPVGVVEILTKAADLVNLA